MATKVKLAAHPEYASDFLMKDSPPIKYNPQVEKVKEKAPEFSVSKNKRFFEQSQITNLKAQLPCSYEKEILTKKSDYVKAHIGYGKKFYLYDYKKKYDISPGPKYNSH